MRLLKFIGVIVGTLLFVFLLVFGFNLDALVTLFENREDLQEGQEWVDKTGSLKGLTEYIGQHPGRVSIASRSAINPDTSLLFSAHKPRTMGTLSNFFLITTYARQVEEGLLDPNERISLDDVERFQLPYIDASNHAAAVNALSNQGWINKANEVPLQQLVEVSIAYNDLAISDFLFFKLGKQAIEKTFRQLNLEQTELPLPFSGLYITLHPSLSDTSFTAHFTRLRSLSAEQFRKQVFSEANRFVKNDRFHKKVTEVFTEQEGLGIRFKERRNILSLFPQSTAAELSHLMRELQQKELLSPRVSVLVQDIMDWPFEQQGLNNDFKYYGAIYDSRLGMVGGIDYGASTYSGEPFAQAVLFDSLQVAFWFHMSSNLIHQDYQQRLMWDPALREATHQEITH